jgi:hypothetical protein
MKFNCDILFRGLITSKLIIIYKHYNSDDFSPIGIDYNILKSYIIDKNINIFVDMNMKLNHLENLSNKLNDRLETLSNKSNEYIDNIFNIEIQEPIMLPNSNDFFEKMTMYLLILETRKHPYTRENLTIDRLIEYNNSEDIKNKINIFLENKK